MERLFIALISVFLTSTHTPLLAQTISPVPSPDITDFSEMIPSLPPKPIQSPTPTPWPSITPTPQTSISPTPAKPQLQIETGEVIEGKRFLLRITLENADQIPATHFPLKGEISYTDKGYDQEALPPQTIPFELPTSGKTEVRLLFKSAGNHVLRISLKYPYEVKRNFKIFSKPFPATVFPVPVDTSKFQKKPEFWHVWVNLYHSMSASKPQRQYYLITYQDEIVQRLLTSSAAPGKTTPMGQFRLGPKIASPKSTLYESVMPFWTTILVPNFSFEYGNHGLIGESYLYLLGTPASHGCLRLSNKWIRQNGEWLNIGGAKWVFNHVPVGTPIHIFKKPVQPFVFENYQMWLSRKQ